jgi:hypothetical protein
MLLMLIVHVDSPCRQHATEQRCLQGEKAIHPLAEAEEFSGLFL